MPSSSSPIRAASRSVASSVTCPGCHGSPEAASAVTRTAVSPHTSALARRSSTAAVSCFSAPRSANDANSFVNGTAAVSACNNNSASSTARRAKSRSSVAALTDCRDCARAANAAIDPGGGWVRSGRNSNNRMIRSSGSSANQVPSGTPGDTSVIVYQPKPAARVHLPVAALLPTATSPGRCAPAHRNISRSLPLPAPPVSPARALPATMWTWLTRNRRRTATSTMVGPSATTTTMRSASLLPIAPARFRRSVR